MRKLRVSGVVILAALTFGACSDKVELLNTPAGEVGILVDGARDGMDRNDQTFISAGTEILVGNQVAAASSNEVVGFTNRRAVAIRTPVGWTSGVDTVTLDLPSEIAVPVTVWIVKGPFNAQRQKAIDACITTSGIWNSERQGVRFSEFEIVDATGDPQAGNYHAFTCGQQAGLQSDIGERANRINIYYVDTVDGGTGRGQACSIGSDFVAMGKNTGDELLSHELGHDFALTHVDGMAQFDVTNVMHSASSSRQFLTEGQLFRSHLRSNSALNAVYSARPGQPTRSCGGTAATPTCVALVKRIWADGAFPAN